MASLAFIVVLPLQRLYKCALVSFFLVRSNTSEHFHILLCHLCVLLCTKCTLPGASNRLDSIQSEKELINRPQKDFGDKDKTMRVEVYEQEG